MDGIAGALGDTVFLRGSVGMFREPFMALSNQAAVVLRVKVALESRGVNLNGPCGAFEITKRVAWELRAQGAGLLQKSTGNNCAGYAIDIIAFQDGSYVDVLVDGGNANTPAWNVKADKVDAARWRAAFDPGDAPPAPPPPAPGTGTPPPVDPNDELARVIDEATARILGGLSDAVAAVDRMHDRAGEIQRDGVRLRLR